jgi:AraC-like DNA-binding protein
VDVLADILSTLRLRSTVYFQADFCAPWGMDIKGGAVANFHLIVKGSCWLRGPGGDSVSELNQGDIVVLPHGDRHALLHAPEAEAPPAESVIGGGKSSEGNDSNSARLVYGGKGDATTLICGHYEYDRAGMHPLVRALPHLIHLKREQQTEWVATASRLAVIESSSTQEGSTAVVNRMAEVLLIQVIRSFSANLRDNKGFLAMLTEPVLGKALSLLHQTPERPWQLTELANACGVSRTSLGDYFKQVLGVAPMQYLTEWRMHKVREQLLVGDESIARIAGRVGYASEWSFSKAYKRVFDEGPGATRQSGRRQLM